MTKRNVATLIPAINEETVIGATLKAVLKQCPAEDIYIADDGSTDNTVRVCR